MTKLNANQTRQLKAAATQCAEMYDYAFRPFRRENCTAEGMNVLRKMGYVNSTRFTLNKDGSLDRNIGLMSDKYIIHNITDAGLTYLKENCKAWYGKTFA